jgi:Transposase IS4
VRRKIKKIENLADEPDQVQYTFSQYFSEDMFERVLNASNKYAKKMFELHPSPKWAKAIVEEPIKLNELKKYFGIRIALGIKRSVDLPDMYNQAFPFNFTQFNVMSRNRWQHINSALHCQDDEETPSNPYHGKKLPEGYQSHIQVLKSLTVWPICRVRES